MFARLQIHDPRTQRHQIQWPCATVCSVSRGVKTPLRSSRKTWCVVRDAQWNLSNSTRAVREHSVADEQSAGATFFRPTIRTHHLNPKAPALNCATHESANQSERRCRGGAGLVLRAQPAQA